MPEIRAERRMGNVVELDLFARGDLFQFQGHFPNEPILPGVAQIDWAARFAKSHLGITGNFKRLGQLKFSKLIVADSEIHLRLEWNREKNRLTFSYQMDGKNCSSGFFELAGP